MGQAKNKLKGCRTTKECDEDYYRVSAQLGDTVGGIASLHRQKQTLLKRQEEIRAERGFAEQQELAIAAEKAKEVDAVSDSCEKPTTREAANVHVQ